MATFPDDHFAPNCGYWRQFETLEIWQVAAMMAGVDPRLIQDVTDREGHAIDLDDDMQMIKSGALAGSLVAVPSQASLGSRTAITVTSLVPWLRKRGFHVLADGLTDGSPGGSKAKKWTDERLAELAACRKEHGTTEAAKRFGFSTAFVRRMLPGGANATPPKLDNAWARPKSKK